MWRILVVSNCFRSTQIMRDETLLYQLCAAMSDNRVAYVASLRLKNHLLSKVL